MGGGEALDGEGLPLMGGGHSHSPLGGKPCSIGYPRKRHLCGEGENDYGDGEEHDTNNKSALEWLQYIHVTSLVVGGS